MEKLWNWLDLPVWLCMSCIFTKRLLSIKCAKSVTTCHQLGNLYVSSGTCLQTPWWRILRILTALIRKYSHGSLEQGEASCEWSGVFLRNRNSYPADGSDMFQMQMQGEYGVPLQIYLLVALIRAARRKAFAFQRRLSDPVEKSGKLCTVKQYSINLHQKKLYQWLNSFRLKKVKDQSAF